MVAGTTPRWSKTTFLLKLWLLLCFPTAALPWLAKVVLRTKRVCVHARVRKRGRVCKLTGVIKQKLIMKSYTDTAVTSWTIKYHLKFSAYREKTKSGTYIIRMLQTH